MDIHGRYFYLTEFSTDECYYQWQITATPNPCTGNLETKTMISMGFGAWDPHECPNSIHGLIKHVQYVPTKEKGTFGGTHNFQTQPFCI